MWARVSMIYQHELSTITPGHAKMMKPVILITALK